MSYRTIHKHEFDALANKVAKLEEVVKALKEMTDSLPKKETKKNAD